MIEVQHPNKEMEFAMKIEPSLSASRLSKVDPGSIVKIEGKVAIVALDSTPPPEKVVAMYDVSNSRFERRVAEDGPLIVFGGEVVLRPDLSSAFDDHPSAASKNEIYLINDRPHVVLHAFREFRLLDLSTGMIEPTQRSSLMTGFRKWEICVRLGSGELLTLMKYSPPADHEAAARVTVGLRAR
jgi:hypothetical protein